MLANYLKLAVRNLLRQKLYSAINVAGFTVGISGCLLLFMFVQNELSYDKFHAQGDLIYRRLRGNFRNGEISSTPYTSGPYAPALAADFPEGVRSRWLKHNLCTWLDYVFLLFRHFSQEVRTYVIAIIPLKSAS